MWASLVSPSGKESTCNAGDSGDVGLIPGSGRSPGGRHGKTLQYSYLENPMDRGAWWTTVHKVAKSWTWLKQLSMNAFLNKCGYVIHHFNAHFSLCFLLFFANDLLLAVYCVSILDGGNDVRQKANLSDFLKSSLSLLYGEGNGNPLQYSCLENPMDRGA